MQTIPTLLIDMEAALLACHASHKAPGFAVRDKLLGASEIGDCARRVVFQRLHPTAPSLKGAAIMATGRFLEPQAVELIRMGANGWTVTHTCLDDTGQLEAFAVGAPLMSHPDGMIATVDGQCGTLDIKRSYSAVVKAAKEGIIWQGYIDQQIAQMGTVRETTAFTPTFGVLFPVDRDNPAHSHMEIIPWDEGKYAVLKARARAIMPYIIAEELPEAEPKRGHCGHCPHRKECPAVTGVGREVATGGLSLAAELEIEAILSELGPLEAQVDTPNDLIKTLRESLKDAVTRAGVKEVQLAGAKVKMVDGKRADLDKKGLEIEFPGAIEKYTKSNPTLTMRVSFV